MTKVIAEIGSNFQPGNLQSALDMIRVAADCGADVAKFQILDTQNINRPQWWKDKCKPWDISDKWHGKLHSCAIEHKIELLFSVFTVNKSCCFTSCGGVKIASSEISNQALLQAINICKAPFRTSNDVLCTQVYMSVPPDKHAALIPALTWLNNCRVTLLHCIPEYPTTDPQLKNIAELAKLGLPVGWSSHVAYPQAVDTARQAVDLGVTVVEAHLRTEDTPSECPDNGTWALLPGEFVELVREVRG